MENINNKEKLNSIDIKTNINLKNETVANAKTNIETKTEPENYASDEISTNTDTNTNTDTDTSIDIVDEIIINILEDHGYSGIDLLNKLQSLYDTYYAQHIKTFTINNYDYFLYLKDSIWFNFEHKINFTNIMEAKGLQTLEYFGSKFPYLTHLFDGINLIPYIYLPSLLKEIEQVITLWQVDTDMFITNIYVDDGIDLHGGTSPTEIIVFERGENPQKYKSGSISYSKSTIVDANGMPLKQKSKKYAYALISKINNTESNGKILFNLLIDLKDAVNYAINYHKDLSLVLNINNN